MSGYSGTPLAKKLGIKENNIVYLKSAPDNYLDLLSIVPENVSFKKKLSRNLDMIHFFTKSRAELEGAIEKLQNSIKPGGMIWVSWPKKSSKVAPAITEDVIREVILPRGLVDVKVCAIDETWSGLKLVIRKELRG